MGMKHLKHGACRESLEEAGCEVHDLQHLFTFYPSAVACSEIFHLYVANVELPTSGGVFGMPDEGEDIQLHLFDYSDAPLLLKKWAVEKCTCHYGIAVAYSAFTTTIKI